MKELASSFARQIMPMLIGLFADGANFSLLATSALDQDKTLFLEAPSKPRSRDLAVSLLRALSEQATKVDVDANTLAGRVTVLQSSIKSIKDSYSADLSAAAQELSADAKSVSAEIAELNERIQKNINDIVQGSVELGSAVTSLGIGALTTIQPALKDEKPSDKKAGEKGDDPLSASYAVDAILAGSGGATKTSQAMSDLKANNEALAAAYQKLAADNALVTVAETVGAQNDLFANAMSNVVVNTQNLLNGWNLVKSGFDSFVTDVRTVTDHMAAIDLTSKATDAKPLWVAFQGELQLGKTAIIHTTLSGM